MPWEVETKTPRLRAAFTKIVQPPPSGACSLQVFAPRDRADLVTLRHARKRELAACRGPPGRAGGGGCRASSRSSGRARSPARSASGTACGRSCPRALIRWSCGPTSVAAMPEHATTDRRPLAEREEPDPVHAPGRGGGRGSCRRGTPAWWRRRRRSSAVAPVGSPVTGSAVRVALGVRAARPATAGVQAAGLVAGAGQGRDHQQRRHGGQGQRAQEARHHAGRTSSTGQRLPDSGSSRTPASP